jgi:proteasome accessory factor C
MARAIGDVMRATVRKLRRALFLMPYVARHPQGVPLGQLAKLLRITPAAMAKEIRDLLQVGVPNGGPADFFDVFIEGRGASARVMASPSRLLRRPPRLTVHEAYALLLGASALQRTGLATFDEALARATGKIRGLLGARRPHEAAPPPNPVSVATAGASRADVFAPLARASRERRVVELDYDSVAGQRRKKIIVEPYGLLNHRGGWYVLGKSRTHAVSRVFVFKVERIRAVILQAEHFVVPRDFDLRAHRGERLFIAGLAPVEIKLQLSGAAARRLGPGFKGARAGKAGTVVVSFRQCPTGWLAAWILRQGPEVRVISPPNLAFRVAELARRVAAAHEIVSVGDASPAAP